MKHFSFLAVVIGLVLSFHPVATAQVPAQTDTGVKLLDECQLATTLGANSTGPEFQRGAHCIGYLEGVANTMRFWRDYNGSVNATLFPPACISNDATNGELARVVVKYLNDHPNKLHERYMLLVVLAFEDAYPCKQP